MPRGNILKSIASWLCVQEVLSVLVQVGPSVTDTTSTGTVLLVLLSFHIYKTVLQYCTCT